MHIFTFSCLYIECKAQSVHQTAWVPRPAILFNNFLTMGKLLDCSQFVSLYYIYMSITSTAVTSISTTEHVYMSMHITVLKTGCSGHIYNTCICIYRLL